MPLQRPFTLGSITLPSNVFCAPLAGCSDFPFRTMLIPYKPGLIYCEMVKMGAMIHGNPQTAKLLDYAPTMHPIGAQICGSCPEMAKTCAKMVEDLGFDVLDLNCGCPVDKITKDGSGSALLKTLDLIGLILRSMVESVSIPVTIKIRAGWDSESIVSTEITQIAEQAGAQAVCIHGRTREQGYTGPANWDYIRDCKKAAKTIKVIGNGDIIDAYSAEKMFHYTGCDAILLARGTMGHPWLVEDIYRHLSHEPPIERTTLHSRDAFLKHMEQIVAYREPHKAVFDLRRVSCWFLRNIRGARHLREAINQAQSTQEIHQLVMQQPWEEMPLTSYTNETNY